jgi:hypothetical protein
VLGWTGFGEIEQSQLFQALFGQVWEEYSPDAAAWFQFSPEASVGVELVHVPLGAPLLGRQVVVRMSHY